MIFFVGGVIYRNCIKIVYLLMMVESSIKFWIYLLESNLIFILKIL